MLSTGRGELGRHRFASGNAGRENLLIAVLNGIGHSGSMRTDWAALPEAVTKEIADRVGGTHAIPATTGDHAEMAASVTGTEGTVFVKAAGTDFGLRSLRFELRVSEAVDRPYSPAVEWHFEAAGWLVVGFEHCAGPHADLAPGSPDLALLSEALKVLGETSAPDVALFGPKARLGCFAARDASKWALKAQQSAAAWMRDLAGWTGQWAAYRSSKCRK